MGERCSTLADAVTRSLAARRYADALDGVQKLVMLDPCEPRWHQKSGEILRTLGRHAEAAAAYRRAARRYEALTLHARASAALRVADSLAGTSAEVATVPLSWATTDRQRQRSQPDTAPIPPREANTAPADEQSFAELLDEEA